MISWSRERAALLARMRAEGLPFITIAHALGVTRSAAIGKAKRLGLGTPPRRPNKVKRPTLSKPSQAILLSTDAVEPLRVHLLATYEGQCRWPLWANGETDEDKLIVCGNACAPLSSYCQGHAARSRGKGTYSERVAA